MPNTKKNKRLKLILLLSAILLGIVITVSLYLRFNIKSGNNLSAGDEKVKASEIEKINIDHRFFDFGLYIQKISIAVPIVPNVDGTNKTAYYKALLSGVAHHKDTALPGEGGNAFIFGHSSTWNGTGDYAEAFARLNDLEKNDQVIIFRQQKGFKYKVWKKEIIAADDFSYLEATKSEQVTLMTCWPIGSNLKRLVVVAKLEQ